MNTDINDGTPIFAGEDEAREVQVANAADPTGTAHVAATAVLAKLQEGWDAETLAGEDVLSQGQADDLHHEADGERLWLSRTGVADGEPFENTVTIERRVDASWITIAKYDGGDLPEADDDDDLVAMDAGVDAAQRELEGGSIDRHDLAQKLSRAGWPSVADSIRHGVSPREALTRIEQVKLDDCDVTAAERVLRAALELPPVVEIDRDQPEPTACVPCLQRGALLALLGPYIERRCGSGADGENLLQGFLAMDNAELAAATAPDVSAQLLDRVAAMTARDFADQLEESNVWACCQHDDAYPVGLLDLPNKPAAIYGRGDFRHLQRLATTTDVVAVVGARRATSYGRECARELGRDLSASGQLVISGLAFGIDACAHRGALGAGLPTVAVLACGPDVAYPAAHRSLWRQISENGMVISELPPGASPWRWTFPARNRIMAVLAEATVVVEAAARSGSLGTAGFARTFDRVVGAVPGPINSRSSAGPNQLLADGAAVVLDAATVISATRGRVGTSDGLGA